MKNRIYYLIRLRDNLYRFTFRMNLNTILMEKDVIKHYYPYYEIIGIISADYIKMRPVYEALKGNKVDNFYTENEEVIKYFRDNTTDDYKRAIKAINKSTAPVENLASESEKVLTGMHLSTPYIFTPLHRFLFVTYSRLLDKGFDKNFLYKIFDYEKDYIYKEGDSKNIELIRDNQRDKDNRIVQNLRNALERSYAFGLYNSPEDRKKVDDYINKRYNYLEQYNTYKLKK